MDGYFALMNASADGIQQSLTASFYALQAELLAAIALLGAIVVAVYALTCRMHAEIAEKRESRYERERRQLLWELLLRDAEWLTFYRFSGRQRDQHDQRDDHQADKQDKGNAA